MKTYKIEYDMPAKNDLRNISKYISETLKAAEHAKRTYESIRTQILTLKKSPERYRIIDIEPYAYRSIRKMPVGNYIVFYIIKEDKEVHILRILHSRRDWVTLL